MTETPFRIVVALDLNEYSEIVLEHALDQAARHDAPDLHFVTVVSDPRASVDDAKRELAELVLPAFEDKDCTDWRVRLHVRVGKAPEEIVNLAGEIAAHLLVVGRFGIHHPHRGIGYTAGRVINLAPCPTYVVGLSGPSIETVAQCPECVSVRTESDGERWFCPAHSAPDRVRLTARITPGAFGTGGGLMW